MAHIDTLSKTIAGEITLAKNPGGSLKKWREIFGLKQTEISRELDISPSVISDYEKGRRIPGSQFIKKYVQTIISKDQESGGKIIKKFRDEKKPKAILDIHELEKTVTAKKFLDIIKAEVISGKRAINKINLTGYTVIDSLQAILELTEKEFIGIYGSNKQRALIFTKVNLGRSPMVAVKVTKPKPSLIVLHGLEKEKVDKLAVKIAESIQVPLAISKIHSPTEIVETLKEKLK